MSISVLNSLGGVATGKSKRFALADPYAYCGTAVVNAAESAPVWTIHRLTLSSAGGVTDQSAINVAWTNRASATYS